MLSDTEGLICIDDVRLTSTEPYTITELVSPPNYAKDTHTEDDVAVTSASTCAERSTSKGDEEALFVNTPLSEIEVIFRSLAGPGVTKATSISCVGSGGPLDSSGTENEDEVFTDLLPGTYTCTIVVDP